MRDFSKVSPQIWRSKRFGTLGDDARMFILYLLTCQHQTSAGCMSLPDAYAAADLHWTGERLQAARQAVIDADMLVHDGASDEYFVRRWYQHNPPTNSKHRHGVERLISELDSEAVQEAAQCEYQSLSPAQDAAKAGGDNRLLSTSFITGNKGRPS